MHEKYNNNYSLGYLCMHYFLLQVTSNNKKRLITKINLRGFSPKQPFT